MVLPLRGGLGLRDREEDVLRLEVAVEDVLVVQSVERQGDLDEPRCLDR